jgi:hypothetical protein
MAQNLDLHIDASTGSLLTAGAARNGTLPTLSRNDSYNLRLRIREQIGSGVYEDLNLTGVTIRVGIGNIDSPPTAGEWKLGLSGTTSPAIAYNATTTQVYNAISGIAGTGVSVEAYSSSESAWVITSATAGSAVTFSGDSFSLFPPSRAMITTRRLHATGVTPSYLVQLMQSPAVYSDSFSPASTAGVVTLSLLYNGSTSPAINETYLLTVGADADSGFISLAYDTEASPPVSLSSRTALASNVVSALGSIAALSGQISVDADTSQTRYTISFIDTLGAQNVTTPLTLATTGVNYARFYNTTLTMSTAELLEMFNVADDTSITPKIEIELIEAGARRTVYQGDVTIKADLLVATTYSPLTYTP